MAIRHYTDDVGRVAIEKTGFISPGRDGYAYFTSDRYASATEAMRKLALPRLPAGYFEIEENDLGELGPKAIVKPRHGLPGGGSEYRIAHPIQVSSDQWMVIDK
jgi:hypothetical protein